MESYTTFRDQRLPGVEIRWYGGPTFNIWVEGEIPNLYHENGWSNTDCFTNYGLRPGVQRPTTEEAEQIAIEHFDEMLDEIEHC